jgi:hypothetical protein
MEDRPYFYKEVKNSSLTIYEDSIGSIYLEIESEGMSEDICSNIEISKDTIKDIITKLTAFIED